MCKLPAILLLTIFVWVGHAFGDGDRTDPVTVLASAERIETNRIYESEKKSRLSEALNELLRSKEKDKKLLELYRVAKTDSAKIYALIGLYEVDKKSYLKFSRELDPNKEVPALWDDVVLDFTVGEWLKKIESGELYQRVCIDPRTKATGNQ